MGRRRWATSSVATIRIVRCDQPGGTRRAHPATLVTDGSIEALAGVLGAGAIDARRFRMLIELEGGRAHEEDTWVGCRVGLGDAILRISAPVPRCAMTTHDPETGHRDLDTLRAIKDYRGLVDGKDLMFGVLGRGRTARDDPPRRPRQRAARLIRRGI